MVRRSVSYASGFSSAVFLGLAGRAAHSPRKTTVRERGAKLGVVDAGDDGSMGWRVLRTMVGESIFLTCSRNAERHGAAAMEFDAMVWARWLKIRFVRWMLVEGFMGE